MPSSGPRLRYEKDGVSRDPFGRVTLCLSYLEAEGVLVARPFTSLWVEEKALLVLLANVVVQVLGKRKLTVELVVNRCQQYWPEYLA